MDKSQVDEIAQAILQPGLKAQEELRIKRAAGEQRMADRRLVAWFSIPGFAIGAAIAWYAGHRFSNGVIWGGITGTVVGWIVVGWRRQHSARH